MEDPLNSENEPPTLELIQEQVNLRLKKLGYSTTVRLFRDERGEVGVTMQGLPRDGSRRIMDVVYRRLRFLLDPPRGRPIEEPTRQVKCRIPESVFAQLQEEARRLGITPARLLRRLATRHVRAVTTP